MFKELIRTMGFMYNFASRGRGRLDEHKLGMIAGTSAMMVNDAEAVLGDSTTGLNPDEKTDLEQAVMMEQHIAEMVSWLIHLEIV